MLDSKKIKLVIFDLDGTLVDTEKIYHAGWRHVLKDYGVSISQEILDQMRGGNRQHNNHIIQNLLGGNEDLAKKAREKRNVYFKYAISEGKIDRKDGALELLKYLKEKAIPIAVATSSPQDSGESVLKSSGLMSYIDFAIYGDQVEGGKPNPDIYLKVLEHYQLNGQKAVAFEDSLNGLLASTRAKIPTYYVPEVPLKDEDLEQIDEAYLVGVYASLIEVKNELEK
ncbi:HAD family hydrolase [Aerococcus mictus]|uniref:HAD family hydrolase n=1 Tax=Aerococcus mictus TaxID=2976810 RepID=UPI0015EFA90B|nr:HAD family phosphatase [Aerococcus mictus]WMF96085.1 HAD family phosphatase [Aerococcus mictus]